MSYYLYINDFNYMISPSHYWLDSLARVISIAIDGKIDGPSVDDIGGVLRYLHGLCFWIIYGRGYISASTMDKPSIYYLYIGIMYRLLSPQSVIIRSDVMFIDGEGLINAKEVSMTGGVRKFPFAPT